MLNKISEKVFFHRFPPEADQPLAEAQIRRYKISARSAFG